MNEAVALEILSSEVALLDRSGTIVWVNDAWNRFCLANGGEPAQTGVGLSYLDVCDSARDADSRSIATAIRAALSGDLPAPETVEISCLVDGRLDRFDVLISARPAGAGAVVSLAPVHHHVASLREELTHELLAVGEGLAQLLTLHTDPEWATLDPTLDEDVRKVVGRLWNALLGTPDQPR